jgi:hypothetical protein
MPSPFPRGPDERGGQQGGGGFLDRVLTQMPFIAERTAGQWAHLDEPVGEQTHVRVGAGKTGRRSAARGPSARGRPRSRRKRGTIKRRSSALAALFPRTFSSKAPKRRISSGGQTMGSDIACDSAAQRLLAAQPQELRLHRKPSRTRPITFSRRPVTDLELVDAECLSF